MSLDFAPDTPALQSLTVHAALDFAVADGVNLGDPVGDATELQPDDIYHLAPGARRHRLAVRVGGDLGRMEVADGSELGQPGAPVHLDCCATFMAPDGATVDALILVELAPGTDLIAAVYMLPLAELAPRIDYALVAVDRGAARARFAELACVHFTRGTRITLATGEQRPIEALRPGDRVLTRNNGVQEIRWIGQRTLRATGAFAPVVIRPGALNNLGELTLSPNHRLFIYQREDRLNTGRREVMVKAERLVNDTTIVRSEGGFIDYFQLLFDDHEIVYAEGIATESMPLGPQTSAALPSGLRATLDRRPRRRGPRAMDLPEGVLDSSIAAEVLRRASSG